MQQSTFALNHRRFSATATWLGTLVGFFKLRIGIAISLAAVAGLVVTAGSAATASQVVVLALTVLVASGAAGGFNQYVERDLDVHMARTRKRPFVTGRFRPGPFWPLLLATMLVTSVGSAAWLLSPMVALYILLGAFVYTVIYTVWLKRRTWLNIVIGGLAGSFAVLAGAAVVGPGLNPAAIALAVVLFLWTPSHFWSLAIARHEDYRAAGVPMLPVVAGDRVTAWAILINTALLVAVSLVPAFYGLGGVYLWSAVLGGAYLLLANLRLVRAPHDRKLARSSFHASLVQLTVLLVGALVDVHLIG